MELDRILRLPEVLEVTGLSVTTLYRKMGDGTFPRPVRLGKNSVGWRSSVIKEWLDARPEVEIKEKSVPPSVRNRAPRREGASRNATH